MGVLSMKSEAWPKLNGSRRSEGLVPERVDVSTALTMNHLAKSNVLIGSKRFANGKSNLKGMPP
jgi:hypothetical protein